MGITQSSPIFQHDFLLENWTQINANQPLPNPNHGRFRTLSNNMTRQLIDQYSIQFFQSQEYRDYTLMHRFRNQHQNLVHAKYLQLQQSKQLCSKIYHVRVFVENFTFRLSQLKDIPFLDCLYILETCFVGFADLYNKIGYFSISEDLICVNHQGIVKVWMNANLSQSYPLHSFSPSPSQKQMVMEIVQIVDANVDRSTSPQSILEYFQSKIQNLTFAQALIILREFSEKNQVQIPKYFQSLLQKLRDESQSVSMYQQKNIFKESSVIRFTRNSQTFISSSGRSYADQLKTFDSGIFLPSKRTGQDPLKHIKKNIYFTIIQDENQRRQSQESKKPSIKFTYQNVQSQEEQPISPITQSQPITQSKQEWNEENLKQLGLDPQIIADLIKYSK